LTSFRRFFPKALGLGGLALAIRVLHTIALLRSPLGDTLIQDARYYHETAVTLLTAGSAGGASFMNLGYPYALAALYAVFGTSAAVAPWAQAILGALSVVALALAARSLLGSDLAGLVAGALYALYAPAIFYDGLVLTPSLINVLLAASLLGLAVHARGVRWSLPAAGFTIGLAILLRANLLLLPPFLAVVLWRSSGRRAAAWLLASALALPAAVVVVSGLKYGAWVPVSANGGMNLWVGNHRGAVGIYQAAEFLKTQRASGEEAGFLDEARRRTSAPDLDLVGADRYWRGEALHEIGADPLRWTGLEIRKLALFWSPIEWKTNVSMRFVERFSPLLRFDPVGFAFLALFGSGGLALLFARGPDPARGVAAAFLAVPLATCVLFFVSGEYRHPASLPLALGAGALARAAVERMPARRMLPAFLTLAIVGVLLLLPHTALAFTGNPSIDVWNFTRVLGGNEGQVARLLRLVDAEPPGPDSDLFLLDARSYAYADVALSSRDPDVTHRALASLRDLLARDLRPGQSGYSDAFLAYVREAIPLRVRDLAAMDLVRNDPALREESLLLGADGYAEIDRRASAGDLVGALAFTDRALAASPHDAWLLSRRGRLLLALGRDREGLATLERSCAASPPLADCAYFAAEYKLAHGDQAGGIELLREALRRDPGYAPARDLLASVQGAPSR
jgi:4-amino-4-deoxy-L-arabinose transferase-like glycosyltransferase